MERSLVNRQQLSVTAPAAKPRAVSPPFFCQPRLRTHPGSSLLFDVGQSRTSHPSGLAIADRMPVDLASAHNAPQKTIGSQPRPTALNRIVGSLPVDKTCPSLFGLPQLEAVGAWIYQLFQPFMARGQGVSFAVAGFVSAPQPPLFRSSGCANPLDELTAVAQISFTQMPSLHRSPPDLS